MLSALFNTATYCNETVSLLKVLKAFWTPSGVLKNEVHARTYWDPFNQDKGTSKYG